MVYELGGACIAVNSKLGMELMTRSLKFGSKLKLRENAHVIVHVHKKKKKNFIESSMRVREMNKGLRQCIQLGWCKIKPASTEA